LLLHTALPVSLRSLLQLLLHTTALPVPLRSLLHLLSLSL
jgi:hypothetical protein